MFDSSDITQLRAIDTLKAVIGNRTAVYILLFIQAGGSGYANQIAKTFDVPLHSVQRQLAKLEDNEIFTSRMVGNARIFEFNRRNSTARNLSQFLQAELDDFPQELVRRYFSQRQKPRRAGKAIEYVPEELRQ